MASEVGATTTAVPATRQAGGVTAAAGGEAPVVSPWFLATGAGGAKVPAPGAGGAEVPATGTGGAVPGAGGGPAAVPPCRSAARLGFACVHCVFFLSWVRACVGQTEGVDFVLLFFSIN